VRLKFRPKISLNLSLFKLEFKPVLALNLRSILLIRRSGSGRLKFKLKFRLKFWPKISLNT